MQKAKGGKFVMEILLFAVQFLHHRLAAFFSRVGQKNNVRTMFALNFGGHFQQGKLIIGSCESWAILWKFQMCLG